jgi:hypothetical protein
VLCMEPTPGDHPPVMVVITLAPSREHDLGAVLHPAMVFVGVAFVYVQVEVHVIDHANVMEVMLQIAGL